MPVLGWKNGDVAVFISQFSSQSSQAEKQIVGGLVRKFPGAGSEALPVRDTFNI